MQARGFFNFFSAARPQTQEALNSPLLQASDIENPPNREERAPEAFRYDDNLFLSFPKSIPNDLLQIIFDYYMSDWLPLAQQAPTFLRRISSNKNLAELLINCANREYLESMIVAREVPQAALSCSVKTKWALRGGLFGVAATSSALVLDALLDNMRKLSLTDDLVDAMVNIFLQSCHTNPYKGGYSRCGVSEEQLVDVFGCNQTLVTSSGLQQFCQTPNSTPIITIGLALGLTGLSISTLLAVCSSYKPCHTNMEKLSIANFLSEDEQNYLTSILQLKTIKGKSIKDLRELLQTSLQTAFTGWQTTVAEWKIANPKALDDRATLPADPLQITSDMLNQLVNGYFEQKQKDEKERTAARLAEDEDGLEIKSLRLN